MPSLRNKSTTQRAPSTTASVPEFPDFNAEFAALPGAQQTNAALQRWWDLVKQRVELNEGTNNQRLFTLKRTIGDLEGSITEAAEISSDVKDYLEARYTINVTAGPVVTGMTLFSATGPNTEVSYVAFQTDRFLINTSSGNKQIFSATASAVKLGDLFTVDLANRRVYVGAGTYGSSGTYWYVDDVGGGRMSLGNKFTWDGSTLTIAGTISATSGTIGGWTIGSTTLSGGNATLDSAGQLILGTSNDIVYLSATDATYRIWIGNVTAGSAAFRVTKTGFLTATGASISGTFDTGSGQNRFFVSDSLLFYGESSGRRLFWSSNAAGTIMQFYNSTNQVEIGMGLGSGSGAVIGLNNSSGASRGLFFVNAGSGEIWLTSAAGATNILLESSSGTITATTFSGSGASLTSLNANNLSTGTVGTARLGSGSATSTTVLHGNSTWGAVAAADVSGLAASATTDTTNASNISSGTLGRPINTTYLNTTGTSADIPDGNLRVTVSGTPVIVLNKDISAVVINGNQIITDRYGSTPTDVATIVAALQYHGLVP